MPNIKSAKKRVKVIATKKLQNKEVLSQMKTAIKKFNAAIAANDAPLAEELLKVAASKIDNAASKGCIHKNNANHKKGQIAKVLHQLKSGVIVVKVDAKTLKQAEQKAAAQKKSAEKAASIAAWKEEKAQKEAEKNAPKKKAVAKKPAKAKEEVVAPAVEEAPKKKRATTKKAKAETETPAAE